MPLHLPLHSRRGYCSWLYPRLPRSPVFVHRPHSYIALAPALGVHKRLAEGAAALAARGPAAAADVIVWAELAHAALNLMTEKFASRAQGVATGTCEGGPDAGFRSGTGGQASTRWEGRRGGCSCSTACRPPPHSACCSPSGVSVVLECAAAELTALPDLLAALGAPLTEPQPSALSEASQEPAAVAARLLREIGCMLVQLFSKSCVFTAAAVWA